MTVASRFPSRTHYGVTVPSASTVKANPGSVPDPGVGTVSTSNTSFPRTFRMPLVPGSTLGPYEIRFQLGQSGMGVVSAVVTKRGSVYQLCQRPFQNSTRSWIVSRRSRQ